MLANDTISKIEKLVKELEPDYQEYILESIKNLLNIQTSIANADIKIIKKTKDCDK